MVTVHNMTTNGVTFWMMSPDSLSANNNLADTAVWLAAGQTMKVDSFGQSYSLYVQNESVRLIPQAATNDWKKS